MGINRQLALYRKLHTSESIDIECDEIEWRMSMRGAKQQVEHLAISAAVHHSLPNRTALYEARKYLKELTAQGLLMQWEQP